MQNTTTNQTTHFHHRFLTPPSITNRKTKSKDQVTRTALPTIHSVSSVVFWSEFREPIDAVIDHLKSIRWNSNSKHLETRVALVDDRIYVSCIDRTPNKIAKGYCKRKLDGFEKEIHRLYFDEELTQRVIAELFGVGEATLSRLFERQNWTARFERRGIKKRKFETDDERRTASKERRRETQKKLRELRESIFGTTCEICGIDAKIMKKILCIHRIDGEEHAEDALWRTYYLRKLNRDEWAPLCISCHRGVHWLMKWYNWSWEDVRNCFLKRRHPQKSEPITREDFDLEAKSKNNVERINPKDMRRYLFGTKCQICKSKKTLVIHRKDGRPHENRILASTKYLRELNPANWVALCRNCHRQITWTSDILGASWNEIVSK